MDGGYWLNIKTIIGQGHTYYIMIYQQYQIKIAEDLIHKILYSTSFRPINKYLRGFFVRKF